MRRVLFSIFLLIHLFSVDGFSQNRFSKTFKKINQLRNSGKLTKVKFLLDSLYKESGSKDFLVERGWVHFHYTYLHYLKKDSLLFHQYLDSLGVYSKKTNTPKQVLNYLQFKSNNNWLTKGTFSKDYTLEMLEAAKKYKDYYFIGYAYSMLANKSLISNNDSLTKFFINKGIAAIDKIENKRLLNVFYKHYSTLHFKEKRYDSAMYYCNKSLSHLKKGKYSSWALGQRYHDKGDIYRVQSNQHQALKYYIKSYKLFDSIHNKLGIQPPFAKLIRSFTYFTSQKDSQKIGEILNTIDVNNQKELIKLSEQKLTTLTNLFAKRVICKSLVDYFTRAKNYEKALVYSNQLKELLTTENEKQRENLVGFYGTKEQMINLELEKENLLMKEQVLVNENKLYRNSLLLLGLLILLVITSSVLITNKIRLNKKEEALKLLESQNALLLSEREKIKLQEKLKENKIALDNIILEMVKEADRLKKLYNGDTKKSQSSQSMDYWSEFTIRFNQVYPNFITKINKQVTNLSPAETKLAMLVLLNLSSKEASTLLAISPTSFVQGKYRLKKKLNLSKEQDLYAYLIAI